MKTRELNAVEVKAWFAKHGGTMVVALDSEEYFGEQRYISDSESVFFSADGTEMLSAKVSYEEGCSTCGGAYIKRWTLETQTKERK